MLPKPPAGRNHGISAGDFTGKIKHLHLPVFNFIQGTRGTSTGPLQDHLEPTGEQDCGRGRRAKDPHIFPTKNISAFEILSYNNKVYCTVPGSAVFSGSFEVYQIFQSLGYCSNDVMIPWKLVSFSSSVILSQATSPSQPEQGLSIWFSRSITW